MQPNNKLVWDEAVRITADMIDNVWKNTEVIEVDHVVDITLQVCPFRGYADAILDLTISADRSPYNRFCR